LISVAGASGPEYLNLGNPWKFSKNINPERLGLPKKTGKKKAHKYPMQHSPFVNFATRGTIHEHASCLPFHPNKFFTGHIVILILLTIFH